METYLSVKLASIVPSTTNPRKTFDETQLRQLADSMATNGLMQPITVRTQPDGTLTIIGGERRFRAAQMLGWDAIDCHLVSVDDTTALQMQIVENLQRADIDPLEEADAYRNLIDTGVFRISELAAKVGRTASHIYGRMRLASLEEPIREAIRSGDLSLSVAQMIAKLESESDRLEALEYASPKWGKRPSNSDVADWIAESITRRVADAPWTKVAKFPNPCSHCEKRTGCQAALFDDLASDSCLDASCWAATEERLRDHLVLAESELGNHVLPMEDAREILRGKLINWNAQSKWVLASVVPDAFDLRRSLGQEPPTSLLKKTWVQIAHEAGMPKVTLALPSDATSSDDFVEILSLKSIVGGLVQRGLVERTEPDDGDDNAPQEMTAEQKAERDERFALTSAIRQASDEILNDAIGKKALKADAAELLAFLLEDLRKTGRVDDYPNLYTLAGFVEESEEDTSTLCGKDLGFMELLAAFAQDCGNVEAVAKLLRINTAPLHEKAIKVAAKRIAESKK